MTNRIVIIDNVKTGLKATFYNSESLKDNLVSELISCISNYDIRKADDVEYRDDIAKRSNIEIITIPGNRMRAYSSTHGMVAYEMQFSEYCPEINLRTLEEITEENIKYLTKGKEMAISNGHEDVASKIQIGINTLEGALRQYKNQSN
tara:strand:+ start:973 stop:1416 length:444 start_codon:yes stop_codon:yes gene_type:complete